MTVTYYNKMCLWNTNAPAIAIFSKTVTLIFDLDRWPLTLYQQKGLVTRYTHVKYEGSNSYQSKDMANVKVFPDNQMDKRMDRQMGQKLYALIYRCGGHKNVKVFAQ